MTAEIKTRIDVIKKLLASKKGRRYLEIGVFRGDVFLEIRAPEKIAVDVRFRISPKRRVISLLRYPENFFNRYYKMTSDRFFDDHAHLMEKFDVVFIDGLHIYEQVLKDVAHALNCLSPNGFIVIHDCNPTSAAMAKPGQSLEDVAKFQLPGWTGEWCGDVWKAILHLRASRNDLKICVLNCDYGVGVVTRSKKTLQLLDIDVTQIKRFLYEDLIKNRGVWLNLQEPDYLHEFVKA